MTVGDDGRHVLQEWYAAHTSRHESLTDLLRTTLTSLVESQGVDYVSVTARTKTLESFLTKASRDKYVEPINEIFDVVAARVITYVESDMARVVEVISRSFQVFPEFSPDKTVELGVDRTGYRSLHLVCEFGDARCRLPEFEQYAHTKFEIQIRTALQHAWAEIEHDRQYKIAGVLPSHLRRRLYILAGVLELADREFDGLVKEIDDYAREVAKKAESGDLAIELNSTSLSEFLPDYLNKAKLDLLAEVGSEVRSGVIAELQLFGVTTLAGLKDLITADFVANFRKSPTNTIAGFLRSAMMVKDLEKYFDVAWQNDWRVVTPNTLAILERRYGHDNVKRALARRGIETYDPQRHPSKRPVKAKAKKVAGTGTAKLPKAKASRVRKAGGAK